MINEKYGIDHTGGFQDQLREYVNKSKIIGYPIIYGLNFTL